MADKDIRIESTTDHKGGCLYRVVDADTGELLTDVKTIVILVATDDVAVAHVIHGDRSSERHYVGKIDVTILAEVVDGSTN